MNTVGILYDFTISDNHEPVALKIAWRINYIIINDISIIALVICNGLLMAFILRN